MKFSTEVWTGIKSLLYLYEEMLKNACKEYDLTGMEADVLGFLQNNPGKDTATDIVELRRLSKGAVSKAVEGLIQKSLLERIPDTDDRRRIHLKIKPGAKPVIGMINETREEFISIVFRGITEEELELHERILRQMFDNTRIAIERRNK